MSDSPYTSIEFPEAPTDRPYTCINMVATIDGKTLTGNRDENVMDLGSAIDHLVLRQIEGACDAIMVGAQSIRATPKLTYGSRPIRIVVTRSGNLNFDARVFTEAPGKVFVLTSQDSRVVVPEHVQILYYGESTTDFVAALQFLRTEQGVRSLLIEGGSELNAELLRRDLIDELFLTLAPKIKLGREVPTYAGGEPLPRKLVQNYSLIACHPVGDEVFLRYRRIWQ